jgi:hypothetical protein
MLAVLLWGCGEDGVGGDVPPPPPPDAATDASGESDASGEDERYDPNRFIVRLVSFEPGPGAGYGQDNLPDIILGPPRGGGEHQGSTHVVSLGTEGVIVVEMGMDIVDGPGPDLIVFENPFVVGGGTFAEPGHVAVSMDGEDFVEHPCDAEDAPDFPGCAGLNPVYANELTNDIDPTDPEVAGGDAFDLADFGVSRARFVRIRDGGRVSGLGGDSEGFDLDAIAVVNGDPEP